MWDKKRIKKVFKRFFRSLLKPDSQLYRVAVIESTEAQTRQDQATFFSSNVRSVMGSFCDSRAFCFYCCYNCYNTFQVISIASI